MFSVAAGVRETGEGRTSSMPMIALEEEPLVLGLGFLGW